MPTLSPSTDYTGASVTQGDKKTFITNVRAFIADVLGTDSANKAAVRALLGVSPVAQDFRLSLTSGLPITTADVIGASTLYASPFAGNFISLFDGTYWNARASAEFSIALSGLTSGKPHDVFAYDDAGVPTLEVLAWTNDTTRATALAYQDGVLSKAGALTRRYLGTFYTTGTTTTEDSKAKRYLWNYYHRKARFLERKEPTASWTYQLAVWRQANGSTDNQVAFVTGAIEDCFEASLLASSFANNGYMAAAALGHNSTTTPSGLYSSMEASSSSSVPVFQHRPTLKALPTLGLNTVTWLEWTENIGVANTWYGVVSSTAQQVQSGITAEVMA